MTARIETASSWIWLDEAGIVHVESKPGINETLDHAVENVQCVLRMMGSTKRPLLVDARAMLSQDKGANDYYRGALNGAALLFAAYVIPSKFGSIIGNLLMPKKGQVPARLFSDDQAALKWLHAQIEARQAKLRMGVREA